MPQHSFDCTHQNVLLPTSCYLVPSYWKWGFSVILPMWYDLHISSDSKSSESKRSICMEFLHAYTPIDMVRMSQTFQNEWVQRSINMELLHAFYTNMTYMAVPQVSGTIITILYLLAWKCVSLRSRFNKPFRFNTNLDGRGSVRCLITSNLETLPTHIVSSPLASLRLFRSLLFRVTNT